MGKCVFCGRSNDDRARYCDFCGRSMEPGKERHADAVATKKDALEKVQEASNDRAKTDKRMSPLWTLVALSPIVATLGSYAAIMFLPLIDRGGWDVYMWMVMIVRPFAMLLFAILMGYVTFLLITRLNEHAGREERMRAGLISYLRFASEELGEERDILDELLRLSSYDGQARVYEKKLDARKWGLMIFIMFYLVAIPSLITGVWWSVGAEGGLYFATFLFFALSLLSSFVYIGVIVILAYLASHLMRTIYTHDVRWTAFVNSLKPALRIVGKETHIPEFAPPLKERSFVAYLLLTIATLGVFAVYWLYVLIRDPDIHFNAHNIIDPAIVEAIQ